METFHKIVLSYSHTFCSQPINCQFLYILEINCKQSLISSRRSLRKKFTFFIPLGIQIEKAFNYINTRQSSKALKLHLNDENLIHDRKTATILIICCTAFIIVYNDNSLIIIFSITAGRIRSESYSSYIN